MKILLLSDTHAQLHPAICELAAVADQVIHAGDIGAAYVLDQLRRHSPVLAVLGNNDKPDHWTGNGRDRLASLETTATLPLASGTIAIEHGHRANPAGRRHALLRKRYPDARLVVYGHSHRLCLDQSAEPWVVNPGAAGRSRTFGGPSCVMLHADGEDWTLQPYRFSLSNWKK